MKKSAIVALLLLIIPFACLSESDRPNRFDISPRVEYKGNWLTVKNDGPYIYEEVTIELNGTFKKKIPFLIGAGEEVRIQLSDFAKADGQRFNIIIYKPVDVVITCQVASDRDGPRRRLGKGFYSGRF